MDALLLRRLLRLPVLHCMLVQLPRDLLQEGGEAIEQGHIPQNPHQGNSLELRHGALAGMVADIRQHRSHGRDANYPRHQHQLAVVAQIDGKLPVRPVLQNAQCWRRQGWCAWGVVFLHRRAVAVRGRGFSRSELIEVIGPSTLTQALDVHAE